jgi:hypothetical protein
MFFLCPLIVYFCPFYGVTPLKAQFGVGYAELRQFRAKFVPVLREVQLVYPAARLDVTDAGLVLHNSRPPISKTMLGLGKGTVIDVTPTSSGPVD